MRFILLLPLFVAVLATPANAGHRVTYLQEDDTRMVISLADNGDARADLLGDGGYFLLLKNEFYVIQKVDGAWQTVKLVDFVAALRKAGVRLDQLLSEEDESLPVLSADFRVEEAGVQTVAGHVGKAYRVYGMPEAEPGKAEIFVMSTDPVLAPVAKLLESSAIAMPLSAGNWEDPAAIRLAAALHTVLALGAPLDTGGHLRLEKVETINVPAAAMRLPSVPLTTEQISEGLKTLRTAADSEPR